MASPEGGVFHLVNERNTKIGDIVAFSRRLFRLTGVEAVESRRNGGSGRNILETLFDDLTDVYRPYMRDERVFAAEGARSILEVKGIACPAFDYAVFSRCMEYAVATEWGGKLF